MLSLENVIHDFYLGDLCWSLSSRDFNAKLILNTHWCTNILRSLNLDLEAWLPCPLSKSAFHTGRVPKLSVLHMAQSDSLNQKGKENVEVLIFWIPSSFLFCFLKIFKSPRRLFIYYYLQRERWSVPTHLGQQADVMDARSFGPLQAASVCKMTSYTINKWETWKCQQGNLVE